MRNQSLDKDIIFTEYFRGSGLEQIRYYLSKLVHTRCFWALTILSSKAGSSPLNIGQETRAGTLNEEQ